MTSVEEARRRFNEAEEKARRTRSLAGRNLRTHTQGDAQTQEVLDVGGVIGRTVVIEDEVGGKTPIRGKGISGQAS
jgi:hypothetical protein